MTSGPQKLPGASTSEWYQTTYPGDQMTVNTIVWHTTEGTSLPDYSGGSMAPNFTAVPNFAAQRLNWFQHFDFDVSSRALVHAVAAIPTNTLNVCQIEVVGTCDPAAHTRWEKSGIKHLYTPELPDWAIRDLAAFAAWSHANHGVPLTSGVAFKPYPESYGTNNGVRLSASKWESFKGHCGHQHVPSGNVHGDPGDFPMAAILIRAQSDLTPSNPSTKPAVSLAHVIAAAKKDPSAAQGHTTYKADVLIVEKALVAEKLLATSYADGSYGSKTVAAYKAWQKKLGYSGTDADGVPGKTSLSRLGSAHGFTVKD